MRRYFTKKPVFEEQDITGAIRQWAYPLNSKDDLNPLFDRIGDASIVMLGEASHGTHEYYTWRTYISKRLIEEKGFNFIAVEGDWPDCYRLNRFIKHYEQEDKSVFDILYDFKRWPTWMWANWETAALAGWLQRYNKGKTNNRKAGFYGLDVYSLWESMESIMNYMRNTDPEALQIAEEAYRCFEPYRKDEGTSYARASQFVPELCRHVVVDATSFVT